MRPLRDGSSPLARGLPHSRTVHFREPGIIPARAGFTDVVGGVAGRRPDHPRSRGVYSSTSKSFLASTGSSPLARGLPQENFGSNAAPGIIPARAGFTWRSSSPRRSAPDHPRSRGVYLFSRENPEEGEGSSPLARGLRAVFYVREQGARIIPARAGFTPQGRRPVGGRTDHPRSRGVYYGGRKACVALPGSSPLARGLPRPAGSLLYVGGIIPARAGFTDGRPADPGGVRDHPRSRGVYVATARAQLGLPGSSPLAWGLRLVPACEVGGYRIIPARAGFT